MQPIKKHSEKGQALILLTLGIIGLVALAGLAIDGGNAYSDRRQAQNAADTAAMGAALTKLRGGNYTNIAYSLASTNGYDSNGVSNDVVISTASTPSDACPATGTDITVTITSHVQTTFAKVIGVGEVVNTVRATSRACDISVTGGHPLFNNNSIFATKKGACNGVNGTSLYVGGSSQVQLWGGGMGTASTDPSCMRFQGGEAQFKKEESGPGCANISTAATSGGNFNSVKPQDGCGKVLYNQTFEDPPLDLGISCSGTATTSGNTMSPGNFSGTFPPAGVTKLNPGTYCIYGDFDMNGNDKLTANGVTFVMMTGGIKWNGNMEMNVSAPTSGDWKGLLVYAPPSNTNQMTVNGSGNVTMTGTFLTQNAPCDFIGSGQLQKQYIQFICYTWQMDGNAQAEIMWDASKFYSPLQVLSPTINLLQ